MINPSWKTKKDPLLRDPFIGLCASFIVYELLERFMRFWKVLCVFILIYGLFIRFMRDSSGLCVFR